MHLIGRYVPLPAADASHSLSRGKTDLAGTQPLFHPPALGDVPAHSLDTVRLACVFLAQGTGRDFHPDFAAVGAHEATRRPHGLPHVRDRAEGLEHVRPVLRVDELVGVSPNHLTRSQAEHQSARGRGIGRHARAGRPAGSCRWSSPPAAGSAPRFVAVPARCRMHDAGDWNSDRAASPARRSRRPTLRMRARRRRVPAAGPRPPSAPRPAPPMPRQRRCRTRSRQARSGRRRGAATDWPESTSSASTKTPANDIPASAPTSIRCVRADDGKAGDRPAT